MSYSNSAAQAATEVQIVPGYVAAKDINDVSQVAQGHEAFQAATTVVQATISAKAATSARKIPGDIAANDITNATLAKRLEAIKAAAVVAQAAATVAVAVAKKAATIDPESKQSASNPCALFGEKRNKTPEDQQPKQEIQSTQKSH